MSFGCLTFSEALEFFEAQPAWRLRETVMIFEDYILYAAQKRCWGLEIPEIESLEATVSVIKSVLGRRGAFQ